MLTKWWQLIWIIALREEGIRFGKLALELVECTVLRVCNDWTVTSSY